MKYYDFEKHIAKKLDGQKAPVDMANLLKGLGLEDAVVPERKVFPFWKLMMAGIVLLGGLSYAWNSYESSNTKYVTIVNENSIDNTGIENPTVEKVLDEIIETKTTNKIITSTSISKTNIEEVKANTQSHSQNSRIAHNRNLQKQSQLTNRELTTNSETSSLSTVSSSVGNQDGQQEGRTSEYNIEQENLKQNELTSITDFESSATKSKSTFQNNKEISKSDQSETLQDATIRENISTPFMIATRDVLGVDLIGKTDQDDLFTRMKVHCPSFSQAPWKLALIPEFGIFAPIKTLSNKAGETITNLDKRLESERSLEGVNFGLHTMVLKDNMPFYLKAGVSYSRIAERTDLNYTKITQDTTIGVISQTYTANGDSLITISGPIITEVTETGTNRKHHYIHLIDLPVSIGYSTYLGGFDIGLEAGVKINLMTRATGNLLVTESDYTNLTFDEKFKRKIGLSYFGGLVIGRNFGTIGDFYFAPRFTYYPTDFTSTSNPISQKYVTIGLNAGFVYLIR